MNFLHFNILLFDLFDWLEGSQKFQAVELQIHADWIVFHQ